ncbi:PIN domain-containing protein [Nesterenkonia muleiensis]|uniref:PIN domain-containing protein n=1 Tax=Nesterenkonia muleiensis TaxID=2282648 RepID=UPI000E7607BC|nr:PIN domain-containing protein [Nesterenkonia muleiensis]
MWFIDSSAALHTVVPDGDIHAEEWFQHAIGNKETLLASTLLRLEFTRVLRRDRQPLDEGDWLLDRTAFIRLDDRVLRYAASIEPHIRSLDAIHLATAVLSETNPTVVTHDSTMKAAAEHLGLRTYDPMQA